MILRCTITRGGFRPSTRALAVQTAPVTSLKKSTIAPEQQEKMITSLYDDLVKGEAPRYMKVLRFKKFVDKMEHIYLSELARRKTYDRRDHELRMQIMMSKTPLHDVFRAHHQIDYAVGFSGERLADCVTALADVMRARGPKPALYWDYDRKRLASSWQMYHFIEDVQHGLKKPTIFHPHHIAAVSHPFANW